jgi:hypothetical protein
MFNGADIEVILGSGAVLNLSVNNLPKDTRVDPTGGLIQGRLNPTGVIVESGV